MDSLITSVVPSIGTYCLTTIGAGGIAQTFYNDKDVLIAAGQAASASGKNAYYAMASFKNDNGRTQDNVLWLKAFWLDVDCKNKDPQKDYADKEEGINAIRAFCIKHSFPKPTIVDSGNGWHVYWILDEAVDRYTWQPVADTLKALCLNDGLRIDPACTADSARILRIPGTNNYRFDPPSEVRLEIFSSPVMFEPFKALVQLAYDSLPQQGLIKIPGTPTKKQLSAVTQALIGNSSSSFKKILAKCQQGTGCNIISDAVANQDQVDEPLWRGVLSIAHHCSDGDKAIHFVSHQHPEYDYAATVDKASQTKGPYTCATLNGLRTGVCNTCPHWGKITSPIQLGNQIVASTAPVTVTMPQQAITMAPDQTTEPQPVASAPDVTQIEKVDIARIDAALAAFYSSQEKVVIPVPPKPFLRGQSGGIYKQKKLEDGTFDDVLIYHNDFYAYARLYDPELGQVLACRLHLPMDGVRNFNIPLRAVSAKDKLRDVICAQGVAANDKQIAELSLYLLAQTSEIERMQREEKARTQMGWQDDHTFVLGAREYSKAGIRHCPPSNATANYQHMFRMEGDMTQWRKLIDIYDQPGFDVHKFVFFLAISSPLLKPIDQVGMMTTLISDESGIGKTTLSMVCNSVWGHPREMLSLPHDTVNATVNRMGVFNSVSLFQDEFTNKSPEAVSDLLYMGATGRGKNRLQGAANIERVNTTQWNMNSFASANASLRDKVASLKASAEGENMRLFEFDMRGTPVLAKAVADEVFPLMFTNYGVAGHLLSAWLVENYDKLEGMVRQVQRKMDVKFCFTSKERNWSVSIACAYTMAYIAKELGIHNWDINENVEAMIGQIERMRKDVQQSITTYDAIIAEFLAENHSSILVIDGLPDVNGLFAPAKNRVINRILARYEPDTGKLFIASKSLRDYCVQRQFSFASLMALSGAKLETRRLSSGAGVVAATTRVVEFDTSAAGIDMSMWHDIEESEAADGNPTA
jgi:hypothetical protein